MNNKIIKFSLCALMTTTMSVEALNVFKLGIINPTRITNDWDGDGIPNNEDPDDDNDGINDEDDSEPLTRVGNSSTPNATINNFNADPISYFSGDSVRLYWSIDNEKTTNLYDDPILTNKISEVTGLTEFNVTPIGDKEYYLDAEDDLLSVNIYEYIESSRDCGNWTPSESNYAINQTVSQTRSCNVDYLSNEPSSITRLESESRTVYGTQYVYNGGKCSNGTITDEDVDELNRWSGLSNTKTQWCNLTELDIRNNAGITEIPDVIVSLSNLDDIVLVRNNISYITPRINELTKLWRFIIGFNNISSVPNSLWSISSLKVVDLGDNNISSLPISNINNANLEYLYVRGNNGSPFNSSICNGIQLCYN